jgi:hypothetical protein
MAKTTAAARNDNVPRFRVFYAAITDLARLVFISLYA